MLMNHFETSRVEEWVPPELASVLLVEADPELRSSRRLLLSSLQHPVLAVSGYREVCCLPADSNCRLVVIDLRPSEREAQRIAIHVRRIWPAAKILLFGMPSQNFDDPLYDDSVGTLWNPSVVIKTALRLIEATQPLSTCKDRGNSDADTSNEIHNSRK
jgi:hypothetical protein